MAGYAVDAGTRVSASFWDHERDQGPVEQRSGGSVSVARTGIRCIGIWANVGGLLPMVPCSRRRCYCSGATFPSCTSDELLRCWSGCSVCSRHLVWPHLPRALSRDDHGNRAQLSNISITECLPPASRPVRCLPLLKVLLVPSWLWCSRQGMFSGRPFPRYLAGFSLLAGGLAGVHRGHRRSGRYVAVRGRPLKRATDLALHDGRVCSRWPMSCWS